MSSPLVRVLVNGVMIVMTTAVLAHRKSAILAYNERCFPPSDLCDSEFVKNFANIGKTALVMEIPKAENVTDWSLRT